MRDSQLISATVGILYTMVCIDAVIQQQPFTVILQHLQENPFTEMSFIKLHDKLADIEKEL